MLPMTRIAHLGPITDPLPYAEAATQDNSVVTRVPLSAVDRYSDVNLPS